MPASDTPIPAQRKNALEKALSVFSDIRAGEGGTVALLILNAFIMMALYYILKPVREGLILSGFGAVVKSYSSAAQAILFVFVVPAYGAFAARVNRVWLLSGMTLFFVSNLLLFILALGAGMDIGVLYYIWLGVFSFMIVSQFWAFANDVYTEEQGRRLFPIIGIGASAGALAGAFLTAGVFEQMSNGALMSLSCTLLCVFALLIVWVNKREVRGVAGEREKAGETLSKEGGFALVRKNRYLLLIAFFVLLLNMVNSVGEFILGSLFQQHAIDVIGAGQQFEAQRGELIRTLYGEFFGWVNLIGLIIQSFLVSRLIKYFGVRGSLFIGPTLSLITYGTTAVSPVLKVVRTMKIVENANDYSTNNTVRQALFLPMPRDVKYKAKAAIDTFFGRTGDALQALVVFIGTQFSLAIPGFAVVNVALVGIWLGVTAGIAREHKRLAGQA